MIPHLIVIPGVATFWPFIPIPTLDACCSRFYPRLVPVAEHLAVLPALIVVGDAAVQAPLMTHYRVLQRLHYLRCDRRCALNGGHDCARSVGERLTRHCTIVTCPTLYSNVTGWFYDGDGDPLTLLVRWVVTILLTLILPCCCWFVAIPDCHLPLNIPIDLNWVARCANAPLTLLDYCVSCWC